MSEKRIIPRICEQCGKDFLAARSEVKKGHGKFCSRVCGCRSAQTKRGYKRGVDAGNYAGARTNDAGYIRITHPEYGGSILEHRYVMEKHLGRPLETSEIVHHINEDRADNRIENLMVMTHDEHMTLHRARAFPWSVKHACCVSCGTTERIHMANGLCSRCYFRQRYLASRK
jgi:hypothetical protein